MVVAFDIDGTLLEEEKPTILVELARLLSTLPGVEVVIWSGGGKEYAETVVRRLGLRQTNFTVMAKPVGASVKECQKVVDLAFDDEAATNLAQMMAIVRRRGLTNME